MKPPRPLRRVPGGPSGAWLMLVLAGCASAPPAPLKALPAVPAAFSAAPPAGPATPAPAAWWQVFGDAELNALVERALRDNPGIEAAAARLAQARALLRTADAERAPQVAAQLQASRQGGPLVNAAGSQGTLLAATAGVSYEVDLFGRLAQGSAAAALDAEARAAWLQGAQLLVQAEVAQTYLALRALDAERQAARSGVAAWADTLRLTEQRLQAGSVPELAVHRLRAELAAAQAEAATLDRRRGELQNALAALLGTVAGTFTLAERTDAALPTAPAVPAGLPSSMLARRPDIAAAHHSLAAAQARSGSARSAWLPQLTLTTSGGHAAAGLSELLQASTRAWGLGALLSLPLLDGGRREAGVQQADASAQLENANYRAQVLAAFKDVEDQLTALRSLDEQARWQQQSASAAVRARSLAEARVRNGLASQLELLDALRSELRSRRGVLQVQAAQVQGTVGLIKALGGGWDV